MQEINKMDPDSIFFTFDIELQKNMMHLLPASSSQDPEACYDTFIQYLTSRSHLYQEYDAMATRLSMEAHEKKTEPCFVRTMKKVQQNVDVLGKPCPLLQSDFYRFILHHETEIAELYFSLLESRPAFPLTFFGWRTLYKSYLLRTHEGVMERLDHLWFRVALFLHKQDFERVTDTFVLLRTGKAIHATPTLFNSGLCNPQLASCFLMGTEDSVKGIFKTISDAAMISKFSGGLGIHVSNIRGKKSYIYGTNGYSNGLMPMLKVYNDTSRYIDQGGGKRKGAFAMYLEPWHSDIFEFVMARRNTGSDEERTRDLFLALWVPDEFMRCVEQNEDWHLMSENQSPGLANVWGVEFETLYHSYIREKRYVRKIKARDLWQEILKSQIETGTPYILYKDTCNRLSNQQNLGTIRSSNLCCEIIEYSDDKEYAVCNLASVSLPSCLVNREIPTDTNLWIYGKSSCFYCRLLTRLLERRKIPFRYTTNPTQLPPNELSRLAVSGTYPIVFENDSYLGGFTEMWKKYLCPVFDFDQLRKIVSSLVVNLNRIIDINAYPLEECKTSNMKNRPIGIGVQGLADVFMAMLEPFDSIAARKLNQKIFETMYYQALCTSNELAKQEGCYSSFRGSPLSKGIFHFSYYEKSTLSPEYDWETLRENIVRYGTRNSLLLAPMPTASTSQILGNTESFEPLTSNFYVRRTLAGEFYVVNKYLRTFLENGGQWTTENIQKLILYKGSIAGMTCPESIKNVFRTVWEIPQKSLIEMAADRQAFIDQSQSLNIYLSKPDTGILTKIHFYGWKKKLKTGCYYLRTRAPLSSQNFTMDVAESSEDCVSCSS